MIDLIYQQNFYEQFDCRNENLKKRVGFFEIESIDKPNVITIALNPKEYYKRFIDHSDNKKQKGRKNLLLVWILILTPIDYLI